MVYTNVKRIPVLSQWWLSGINLVEQLLI